MHATVVAEDVSRWYGDVVGLSGAHLAVGSGVTGLLGPNGAGKSTLVRILSAQIRPSRGRVTVLGQPVWGNSALFDRIGYCPEGEAVWEGLRAAEFLGAMLALNRVEIDELEVGPALAAVNQSWFWVLGWAVLVGIGIWIQYATTKDIELPEGRWSRLQPETYARVSRRSSI